MRNFVCVMGVLYLVLVKAQGHLRRYVYSVITKMSKDKSSKAGTGNGIARRVLLEERLLAGRAHSMTIPCLFTEQECRTEQKYRQLPSLMWSLPCFLR